MRIRSLMAAMALASGGLVWAVPAVVAECPPRDIAPDRHLDVRYAFTATVVEVSGDVDPPGPNGGSFDWHVELHVERVYRGNVPTEISFNGWTSQCWFGVRGDQLRVGERVFVAGQRLRLAQFPTDPFAGDLALWIQTGDHWRYALDVLTYDQGTPLDPDSRAVREASTTSEILALVRSDAPDTSIGTAAAAPPPTAPPFALLAAAFLFGLGASVWRLRRQRFVVDEAGVPEPHGQ